MNSRFTIGGSDQLESELSLRTASIAERVRALIPASKLQGIVLGGGYGRGEGGVLSTHQGDRPYNDLEFYVFLRGPRLLNQRRFRDALDHLAEQSSGGGLHTEFKIDSLARLRRSSVTMFSYDLVSGHKIVAGAPNLFQECEHHLSAENIPLSEATRLLFNRCGGLLLIKSLLAENALNEANRDFVGRNLAKVQLALGDALLTASGQYHWSCLERSARMQRFVSASNPKLEEIRRLHLAGVQFKLHPHRSEKSAVEFERDHRELEALTLELWLWLESRRLSQQFNSSREYALSRVAKCPEKPIWRNYALNVRTFGVKAGFDTLSRRYPRERLFNALALLLWEHQLAEKPALTKHVQRQLQCKAPDWSGLVSAFKRLWPAYG